MLFRALFGRSFGLLIVMPWCQISSTFQFLLRLFWPPCQLLTWSRLPLLPPSLTQCWSLTQLKWWSLTLSLWRYHRWKLLRWRDSLLKGGSLQWKYAVDGSFEIRDQLTSWFGNFPIFLQGFSLYIWGGAGFLNHQLHYWYTNWLPNAMQRCNTTSRLPNMLNYGRPLLQNKFLGLRVVTQNFCCLFISLFILFFCCVSVRQDIRSFENIIWPLGSTATTCQLHQYNMFMTSIVL